MHSRVFAISIVAAVALAIVGGVGVVRLQAMRRFQGEVAQSRDEMNAGLFVLARNRLLRLARDCPDNSEITYQLGRCEAARGKLDAALIQWARVPADSPWAAAAALDFAQAAISIGRVTESERMLRRAMERPGPELPALRRMLLILVGQQGRLDEARRVIESQWKAAATRSSLDFEDRLAMLHEHAGLDFEIFPLKFNLSQLEHESPPVSEDDQRAISLARVYLATRSGELERAKSELVACAGRWPDDPEILKSWLDWAIAADDFETARKAAERLPDRLFDAPAIRELRAWFAHKRHDDRAERTHLDELIALDPARPAALSRLAELAQQAGDLKTAVKLRRRKTELDAALDQYGRLYREDRYAEHLSELGRLAEGLGRRLEARGFWEILSIQDPADIKAKTALDRIKSSDQTTRPESGTLAQRLTDELHHIASANLSRAPELRPGPRARSPRFDDRAIESGLATFIQRNGESANRQLPETFSGGIALLDFDGDGFIDVYCVQGGSFPPGKTSVPCSDKLFRNLGDGRFEDVSNQSRVATFEGGYGHGVTVGDYDNDGKPDLFVTRWRSYALYRNCGNGRFEDVTASSGLGGDRDWPTSSAFADLDNDGDLDLYVCHYGEWNAASPRVCHDPAGQITIVCDPRTVKALPDHVFRNDRGKFTDVTSEAGIIDRDGRGLGVVAADLDRDGLVDLFVANDSTANFLFRNQAGFRFEEIGHEAGVAANAQGGYQAGMGVACGDLDGDGLPDLAVTNFYGESTSFFHNLGGGLFADHTSVIGLTAPSRYVLGFGVAFLDANNDGRLDLLTANGHVSDTRPLFPYAMPPQLYLGEQDGRLIEVKAEGGPPFQQSYVGRGLATGDLDNDGRVDAVMVAQNEPIVYFQNEITPPGGHYVSFQLEGRKSNRDGVGAALTIICGSLKQFRQRTGGGSFQSASDPRLHFGVGDSKHVDSVEIRWPSGQVDVYHNLETGRTYRVIEGAKSPQAGFGVKSDG